MKIEVLVKAGAKKNEVGFLQEGRYRVLVKEKAIEGKANRAVRDALAAFFKVPKSCVLLLQGKKSQQKVFQIENEKNRL